MTGAQFLGPSPELVGGEIYVEPSRSEHDNIIMIDPDGGSSEVGPVGPQGIQGVKGDKGDTGVGEAGPQGLKGDTGSVGPQGPEGTAGIQGIDGTAGTAGIQGEQGIQGDKGDTGPQGIQGDTGSDGPDGTAGVKGDKGDTGPVGPQGDIGPTGNTGADSVVTGPIGPTGDTGTEYLTTSSTSLNMSTYSIGETVSITLADANMGYSIGQILVITYSVDLYFIGAVTSFSGTALEVELLYKLGIASASSWTINLAGMIQTETYSQWYLITATAGATIALRNFSGPSGWSIGAATTISVTGLSDVGANANDLIIKHDTGLYAIDCIIYTNDGTKFTKTQIPVSYDAMFEDLTHIAIKLSSFCTQDQALLIHVKLQ